MSPDEDGWNEEELDIPEEDDDSFEDDYDDEELSI